MLLALCLRESFFLVTNASTSVFFRKHVDFRYDHHHREVYLDHTSDTKIDNSISSKLTNSIHQYKQMIYHYYIVNVTDISRNCLLQYTIHIIRNKKCDFSGI